MKLFGLKIRPEVDDWRYWLHLVLLVLIVYFLVGFFVEPMPITFDNVGLGVLFLGVADVVVHTVLKLD